MSFIEFRFPDNISENSKGGPGFNTAILEQDSGVETRIARWNGARRVYNVAYGIREWNDLTAVTNLFIVVRGATIGFRYKDWLDYATTDNGRTDEDPVTALDEILGNGDGTTTQFQLVKRYTEAANTRIRTIAKPVSGTVEVALDGVVQSSGFTVDTTTGIITFTSAPGNGVAVTAGCEFDVPVRFSAEASLGLMANLDNYGDGTMENIGLVEILEGSQTEDEQFMGNSTEVEISANYVLSRGVALAFNIAATVAGLSVSCPATAGLPPGGIYFMVYNSGAEAWTLKDDAGTTLLSIAVGAGAIICLRKDSLGALKWMAFG